MSDPPADSPPISLMVGVVVDSGDGVTERWTCGFNKSRNASNICKGAITGTTICSSSSAAIAGMDRCVTIDWGGIQDEYLREGCHTRSKDRAIPNNVAGFTELCWHELQQWPRQLCRIDHGDATKMF
jgi:hypothetical protein